MLCGSSSSVYSGVRKFTFMEPKYNIFLIGSRIFLPFFTLPKNLMALDIHECLKPKFKKHSKEQNSF